MSAPGEWAASDELAHAETMRCPKCWKEWPDVDGLGVLYCPEEHGGCGYCTHAAITAAVCDFCGAECQND